MKQIINSIQSLRGGIKKHGFKIAITICMILLFTGIVYGGGYHGNCGSNPTEHIGLYAKFDNNVTDERGINTGVELWGVGYSSNAIYGSSLSVTDLNTAVNFTTYGFQNNQNMTIMFWLNITGASATAISVCLGTANNYWYGSPKPLGTDRFVDVGVTSPTIAAPITNVWYHYTFWSNASHQYMNRSGTYNQVTDGQNMNTNAEQLFISGCQDLPAFYTTGLYDELVLFNCSLSDSDVTYIKDNGVQSFINAYKNHDALNISDSLPADGSVFNIYDINFNISVNSTYPFNCTLNINNSDRFILKTVEYSSLGAWTNLVNVFDGNLTTYGHYTHSWDGTAYSYFNYSLSNNLNSDVNNYIFIKDGNGQETILLNKSCRDYNNDSIILLVESVEFGSNSVVLLCYDGSWVTMRSKSGSKLVYEIMLNTSYVFKSNSGTNINVNYNVTFENYPDGKFNYSMFCINNITDTSSTSKTIIIDTTNPNLNLNPNNLFNQFNNSNVNSYGGVGYLNLTFTDNNDLFAYYINITRAGIIYFNETNESISGISYTFAKPINYSSWPIGTYDIEIMVSDSHTNNNIKDYKTKTENKKLTFDTEEGNQIIIESEEDAITDTNKFKDRYNFKFSFNDTSDNDTSEKKRIFHLKSNNKILYKSNSEYDAHFIIFNSFKGNWIDFEGSGSNYEVEKVSDYHYKITFDKIKSDIEFSSIGGLNINTFNYQWYVGNYSINEYPLFGSVNETANIYLNLSFNNLIQSNISTHFYFNGTLYPSVIKNIVGSINAFTSTFQLPSTNATYNYTWVVNVTQVNGLNYSFQVNGSYDVLEWLVYNCSSGNYTLIMDLFHEDYPFNSLIGDVEIQLQYWLSNKETGSKFYYHKYTGGSKYYLCIFPPNKTFYADFYSQYAVSGGFTHRYYLFNHSLTTDATNLTLFNYNDTTGISDLSITVRYITTYNYFENIVSKLQRRYVNEGIWRTVQMDKSGDFGNIFFNIHEQNTDYRMLYYDINNNLLLQTTSMKFVCDTSICQLTQLLNPSSAVVTSDNISISWAINNATKIININWSENQGNNVNVQVRVAKSTNLGFTSICSVNQSGAAGTVNCNVTGYFGEVLLTVLTSHSPFVPSISEWIVLSRSTITTLISRSDSVFITFIFMLLLIGIGFFSPLGVIIALMISLIGLYFLGVFAALSLTFVIIAGVMGFFISMKVKK